MTNSDYEVPRARFPRLTVSTWVFGRTWAQCLWLGAAALLVLANSMRGLGAMVTAMFIAVPVGLFGWFNIGGRPLVTLAWNKVLYLYRRATGQTTAPIRPEKPIKDATLNLPGPVGARISVWSTEFGGAIAVDAGAGTASVVIACQSSGFMLATGQSKTERAKAWGRIPDQILGHHGIIRLATHARTIPESVDDLARYYNQTSSDRGAGADASGWADEQARAVIADIGNRDGAAVRRDVLVVATLDMNRARGDIKAAGGGKAGLAVLMAKEVESLAPMLEAAGAKARRWCDSSELLTIYKQALDPDATATISTRRAADLDPVTPENLRPSVIDEHPTYVQIDGTYHRTWWIAAWPSSEVEAGFLSKMLCEGTYGRTFTHVLTTLTPDRGHKSVRDDRMSIQSKIEVDQKQGRPVQKSHEMELADVDERELELAEGYALVKYTGYVTVNAPSLDALEVASREVMSAGAHIVALQLLRNQQAAGLNAAALPLGWGLK